MGGLTHGSLFTGIGGFDLGAEMSGIPTAWHCEINPYCQKLLKQRFPESILYPDIRTMQDVPYVDIISGGFPCQDISIANNSADGITGKRSGLWSEMARIIRDARPKYVLIENSPMLLVRGFERVLCDLSQMGYHAEWACISASDFGFPHKRERVYIIAYADGIGRAAQENFSPIFAKKIPQTQGRKSSRAVGWILRHKADSQILRNDDGIPFVVDRIAAVGNAVIPEIAKYLFSCVITHNRNNGSTESHRNTYR